MICDLVIGEYEVLYSTYESYNDQSLTLKGWSVTVGLAGIIAAYTEHLSPNGRISVFVAALSSIPFWIIDALWKNYQQAYEDRIEFLEAIGDCSTLTDHQLGIYAAWQVAHDEAGWLHQMLNPNVSLPHIFILVVGVLLAIAYPPKQPIQ